MAEPALRFLHYAALLGLFGWTAFGLIGLRGFDRLPLERGAPVLIGAAFAAPLLSTALMLTSIAAMMAAQSIMARCVPHWYCFRYHIGYTTEIRAKSPLAHVNGIVGPAWFPVLLYVKSRMPLVALQTPVNHAVPLSRDKTLPCAGVPAGTGSEKFHAPEP